MEELTLEQVIDGFRYSPLSMEDRGRSLAAYLNSRADEQNDKLLINGRMIQTFIALDRIEGSVAHIIQSTLMNRIDETGFIRQQQDFHEFTVDLAPQV